VRFHESNQDQTKLGIRAIAAAERAYPCSLEQICQILVIAYQPTAFAKTKRGVDTCPKTRRIPIAVRANGYAPTDDFVRSADQKLQVA
jgi:hypothetical protein